ncbi:MAG: uroporphyrinogen-III C-methyltransferase [Archaeoglobaceae archaeon]
MLRSDNSENGKVYLVGSGPGNPELLTVKALRVIERADIILYDKLVGEDIIKMLKDMDKQIIYVGKKSGERGGKRQDEINLLLKKFFEERKHIVRLKGGDPFIFGRGGVEAEFMVKEKIPFEIIPGVSSISSVPTCAGIPLTHPNMSSTVLVVTGRDDIDAWSKAPLQGTIVVLMGRDTIRELCNRLIKAGRDPLTPVAIIESGSTDKQKMLTGDLLSIADVVDKEKLKGPVLIVVGDVVKLSDQFNHR